ncbi:CRISPR-associated endoribonuclease Cas6 [Belliella kenyensis]|uniref:CRISPR-associated endoribonuclease n=1 Tax=Belliella kenyensis TaxID=1472724 RepID=A0ABV8ERP7_9BACT|nr:CRISPR-associated endoribonuclease Cas6 [Belliella kenyensis]MCH7402216.1 CRISPR-associated endoribonuclease Cas6 [Belliella kenyensis]MDN3601730.1 CRISPR-associated endoribonuclease Cas6 [Belliella kenyensis]
MRFRIHISKIGNESFLPINYQYELSSAIYKTIDRADSDFSRFLHEEGYLAYGNKFRLFTFSRIFFERSKVIKDAGRIHHQGQSANFEISFLIDRAAEGFIKGLFIDQDLVIGDKISKVTYEINSIEAIQAPVISEVMQYRCLSPIFIRRKRKDGGEDYLHPEDPDYGILLIQNLLSKSKAFEIANSQDNEGFIDSIPNFSFKPLGKIYKNGVKIKQLTAQATMLIGYMYEFEFRAPKELQELGYYAGFGHLGSQGFGCVEVKS